MPQALADIVAEARLAGRALLEFGQHLFNPTVRLGVTGLSRSGKTVFITALVHGLTQGGRFPVFEPLATGRIARARLAPQPDDAVPRFDYEGNLRALTEERRWPQSTDRISELRLLIDYQSQRGVARTLTIDIVDYPGEWLLDLPLLGKTYQQWSAESLALSAHGPRAQIAAPWRAYLATLDPCGPGRRAGGAAGGGAVHRVSQGLSGRALRHEPAAARPLPHAGRSGGLARAHVLAAAMARAGVPASVAASLATRITAEPARRLARRHDAAAVRGL